MTGDRIDVVLSTDCGTEIDDQWAVAHLALSPKINLLGIVSSHAPNVPAPSAEHNAREVAVVFDKIGLRDRPPIVVGSSDPINGAEPGRAGAEYLIEQSRDYGPDNRLNLLVIGPATDLALALATDPAIVDRVKVVAMGFDGWPMGRDGWNVKNDIPAWQALMDSEIPLTVGDSAICIQELVLDPEGAQRVLGRSPGAEYLAGLVQFWSDTQGPLSELVTGSANHWPIWDEIVVAHLLGLTAVQTYVRPMLRDDGSFGNYAVGIDERRKIDWIVSCDSARLWSDLASLLKGASS